MKQPTASSRRRRFERVVILVDVKVLIEQADRRSCAAQIFSTVVTVLDKCNELSRCSTLWGYLFFDSSRSPLASKSAIRRLVAAGDPTCERFDGISQNLEKFGKVLEAVVTSGDGYTAAGESRADCLVRTLAGVASDFQWDPLLTSDSSSSDEEMKVSSQHHHALDLHVSDPNLVILFSCLPTCSRQLARFLDLRASLEGSALEEKLVCELGSRFTSLQSALDSKSIKCCWIDVPARQNFSNSGLCGVGVSRTTEQGVARRCLFEIGWNFASLSLVANITYSVPLRLIWNMIAYLAPKALGRRVVDHFEAHVRCLTTRLRPNSGDAATFLSVEVQPWSSTVLATSSVGYVSRLSRLFGKENLDASDLSSTSNRGEIVIISRLSRKIPVQYSAERYLVLEKRSEASSFTDTEKLQSGELKAGELSWTGLLISLEREESVALVTVDDGVCTCQATLEPFTPDSGLLTIVEIAGSTLRSKPVTARQSLHLSRASRICFKGKLEKYAEERGKLPSTDDSIKAGIAGAGAGDITKFEESFDSTLLKVVKEKRRGSVLFRSMKKHRADGGKTLDHTHDCFQGSSCEPEKVSWQEYWRRMVKRLQREHMHLDSNCTISSSFGVTESSIDLPIVEQFSQKFVHTQVEGIGTSVVRLEPLSDLGSSERGSDSPSQSAVEHVPSESCYPAPSTQLTVGGDSQLCPSTSPGHESPSFSDSCHISQSRSRVRGDDEQEETEVLQTPTDEIPPFCTSIFEEKLPTVTPCKIAANGDAMSAASPGYFFIQQLVPNVLTLEGVDLHQFAKSVVSEAYSKLRLSDSNEVGTKGALASETDSNRTSDTSFAFRMKKLLLKRPKHLLSKYKQHLASAATASERKASIVGEKLREYPYHNCLNLVDKYVCVYSLRVCFALTRQVIMFVCTAKRRTAPERESGGLCQILEAARSRIRQVTGLVELNEKILNLFTRHELQILFRLEILALEGEFYDKAKQESFTREVCQLLDNIQFHLVGLNGCEGGLQQYCDAVIVSRYKDALPSTISKIFSVMELNGYCDPSLGSSVSVRTLQSSENQPSSGDAVPESEPEATEPSSGAACNSAGQENVLLSNRSRFSGELDCKGRLVNDLNVLHSTDSSGKENVAPNVPHKQGRQRKMYHFSSGAHNLLRVKAVKPHEHVAVQPRKMVRVSRSFAARRLDHNSILQATNSTLVLRKEEQVLQNLAKNIQIVCQTPNPQTRRL